MDRPTILEVVGQFLNRKKNKFNGDLVSLWSPGMETQINVREDIGQPVPDKPNLFFHDGYEFGSVRIPKDANSKPHFYDYPAPWPPEPFVSCIGMSGWNWKEQRSYWIGFEIDDVISHAGTGISQELIDSTMAAIKKLPYVNIRRGTSGIDSGGRHIYVPLAGIPTANHGEHAVLARAVVAKIAADTGLDIEASIDVCGRILWCWARRASEEKRSYECLKMSTTLLTEDDLPNWRDQIRARIDNNKTVSCQDALSVFSTSERTAEHDRFFDEYQKRGWPLAHKPEFNCYHMHRYGMKETADALGLPPLPTSSPGTDKTKVNVKVYLRVKGFDLVCFADTKECSEWSETKNGESFFSYRFTPRPVIKINTELDRMVREAIQSLCDDDNTYQRGLLCEVVEDPPRPRLCLVHNGAPQLREITHATLMRKLSTCAQFKKYSGEELRAALPPDSVVKAALSSADFPGIPVITNVTSCPMLRADGTIAKTRGYDPLTGLFLDIQGDYPELMNPKAAVAMLEEVVCDFPFVTSNHRSAWIAAVVTMVSRAAFAGPAPLFLATANQPGAGKTLAFDAMTAITEGRPAARYAYPKDPGELRKVITSVAINGSPYVFLDNVDGRLGGHVLENALTAPRWTDRVLGINRTVDLPLNVVFVCSGNNCKLTHALVRRTCAIELRTDLERPDLRNDFKHADLLGWIKANRRLLVTAAISIPAHYILAGKPKVKLESWGSFEGWSDLVRAAIVYAGLPDPDTRESLASECDDDTEQLGQLMAGWEEIGGIATVGEAVALAAEGKAPSLAALLDELPDRDRKGAIGCLLRDNQRRVLNGKKFERTDHKIPRWHLVDVAGDRGETGAPGIAAIGDSVAP